MDIPDGSEEAALHVDSWVIDSLDQITVPVLLIVGENDKRFAPSIAVFEKYLDVKASGIVIIHLSGEPEWVGIHLTGKVHPNTQLSFGFILTDSRNL